MRMTSPRRWGGHQGIKPLEEGHRRACPRAPVRAPLPGASRRRVSAINRAADLVTWLSIGCQDDGLIPWLTILAVWRYVQHRKMPRLTTSQRRLRGGASTDRFLTSDLNSFQGDFSLWGRNGAQTGSGSIVRVVLWLYRRHGEATITGIEPRACGLAQKPLQFRVRKRRAKA